MIAFLAMSSDRDNRTPVIRRKSRWRRRYRNPKKKSEIHAEI